MLRLLRLVGLFLIGSAVVPQVLPAQDDTVVLRGARLLTITNGEIPDGVIVFSGGRITAVGADVPIPTDARVFDLPGKTIMPGLIDGFTNLGLADYPTYGEDDDEATSPVTPHMRVVDGLNPANRFFLLAGNAGITSVLSAPAEGNLVTGQSALLHTHGQTTEQLVIRTPVGVHVTLGDSPKIRYGGKNQTPMTRMGAAALLRQTLIQAREYADKLRRYERKQSSDNAEVAATPPARDLKLEALVPVLSGDIPLIVSADRFDDIHTALRITMEFGASMVLNRGAEAHRAAETLALREVPVIWGPADAPYRELESMRGTPRTPALLADAGVLFAFQTGGVENVSGLLEQARIAVAHGLSREEALRALTINPAQILGASNQLGSLEVGKLANLVVFSGNPLDPLADVDTTFVNGIGLENSR